MNNCNICGEGKLKTEYGINVFYYRGLECKAISKYQVCDHCSVEQADEECLRFNAAETRILREYIDGKLPVEGDLRGRDI